MSLFTVLSIDRIHSAQQFTQMRGETRWLSINLMSRLLVAAEHNLLNSSILPRHKIMRSRL